MYNLFITADSEAWKATTFYLPGERCLQPNEYTDKPLADKYGRFDEESIKALMGFPCIFAYEAGCGKDPKFGWLTGISKMRDQIKIEYQIVEVTPWITEEDMGALKNNLDIGGWEIMRTHWALKNVDLLKELGTRNIKIPLFNKAASGSVNIDEHEFQAAFSFPGESRDLVKKVADELNQLLPKNSVFYDDFYTAQLARPSLDSLLQRIYGKQSALLVVFLSGHYDRKEWCGIEFRAIREIIKSKEHNRIMYIRTDDRPVEGVLTIDGYVDATRFTAKEIAEFIRTRIQLLS